MIQYKLFPLKLTEDFSWDRVETALRAGGFERGNYKTISFTIDDSLGNPVAFQYELETVRELSPDQANAIGEFCAVYMRVA